MLSRRSGHRSRAGKTGPTPIEARHRNRSVPLSLKVLPALLIVLLGVPLLSIGR